MLHLTKADFLSSVTFLISEKAMSSLSTCTPLLRLIRLARKGLHVSVIGHKGKNKGLVNRKKELFGWLIV